MVVQFDNIVSIGKPIQFREIEPALIAVVAKVREQIDHRFIRLAAADISGE